MRALILTEGGKQTGFGHVARCGALRVALDAEGVRTTLVINGDRSLMKICDRSRDRIFDWLRDSSARSLLLSKTDIVIIDSYLAPLRFYGEVAASSALPVYIDDCMRLPYPRGIVVNGTIEAERFPYSEVSALRHLLGVKYALLRKAFWGGAPKLVRREIRDVLITFGGIDRSGLVEKILKVLMPRFEGCRFHVVASRRGPRSPRAEPRIHYYSGLDAREMRALMRRCDAAISGGGQTTNELSACGVPALAVCFAANQMPNLLGWQKKGALKYIGDSRDPSLVVKISDAFAQLSFQMRRKMSSSGRRLVDGKGALRVARAVIKQRGNG